PPVWCAGVPTSGLISCSTTAAPASAACQAASEPARPPPMTWIARSDMGWAFYAPGGAGGSGAARGFAGMLALRVRPEGTMARIDIGAAALSGVRLVVSRPLTVLVWGLLVSGYIAVLLALFGGGLLAAFQTLVKTPAPQVRPELVLGMFGSLVGLFL